MARLTIRDIAALAGVSKSTVSLVLNNSPKVDPATRRHVLAVIRRNNYVPSFAATALARGSTRLIGMVVPGLTWHMVASINLGVARVAERTGYDIILYTSVQPPGDYGPVIDRILTSSLIAGLLVVPTLQPLDPLVQLSRDGLPVVVVSTLGTRSPLPSVTADSYAGAVTAVSHLLELGHERIACVQGPMEFECCQDRYSGYLDTLRAAGIQPDPELTKAGGFDHETARSRSRELFALPPGQRPTAVFAHSDITAYAVMKAAADAGLRIPEDVSVVGFDDIESAGQVPPPLTTIRQPFFEMGIRAAEILMDRLSGSAPATGEAADPVREQLPTSLVIRQSCAPPPVRPEQRARPAAAPTPLPVPSQISAEHQPAERPKGRTPR